MHIAVTEGFTAKEMVELLIANSANVRVRDMTGRTPLHVAAGTKGIEVASINLLLKVLYFHLKFLTAKRMELQLT